MTSLLQNELITVQEAAAYLRVPVSWVYERTRRGAIPTRKIGGHVRIPKAPFLRWIEDTDPAAGRR